MNYSIMFKELTYAGVKVFFYRAVHPEELTFMGFGRWLGLEYENARKTWQRGNKELEEKGYIKEDKWTQKTKDIIKGKG